MTTKAKLVMFLFVLVLVLSSLACNDTGGIQDAGRDAVDTVLFETSKVEQTIQQAVDDSCDTRLQVCDPVLR
jgi:hypothetical protein